MAACVKGCEMSALTRRTTKTQKSLPGRRHTSLEGGNRGEWRCGSVRLPRYGDLTGRTQVGRGSAADQPAGELDEGVFAGAAAHEMLMMHEVRNVVIHVQGKTVLYRR